MRSNHFFFCLIIFIFFIPISAMKHHINNDHNIPSLIIALSTLPKEIWTHIIAYSTLKNRLRETCSYFSILASRKNKDIFLDDQLRLSQTDLRRFVLYYADLEEDQIVYNLLLHGASSNTLGDHGITLMGYAIQNKNSNLINTLLKRPDITSFTKEQGEKGLAYLAPTNDCFIIGLDKSAALFFFAKKNNSVMIKDSLLSKVPQQDKRKALALSATYGSIDVIRILLAHGTSPNFISDSPLHIAARRGYTNILKLFIQNGARINDKNFYHFTPLHCAIKAGYINSVQFLIDQGASVNTRGGNNHETSLIMAIKFGYIKIIEMLLNNHININEKVSFGDVALHYAVYYDRINVVRKLLTYPDIQINMQNNNGETPLNIAINNRQMDIVSILLDGGGESGVDNRWNQINQ